MFSHCTTKNSILRRKNLLKRTNSERAVMHSYKHCSHLQKKCRVNNEFDRSIEYVHLNRKCNLTFSLIKWKRIKAECNRVLHELLNTHKQMQEIFARTTHLQNLFEFLKTTNRWWLNESFETLLSLRKMRERLVNHHWMIFSLMYFSSRLRFYQTLTDWVSQLKLSQKHLTVLEISLWFSSVLNMFIIFSLD